jgi:SOS-response transcriptional repressor LexA
MKNSSSSFHETFISERYTFIARRVIVQKLIAMDLKNLIHRELCEGMTEEQLASAVGVSPGTLADILTGKEPKDPAIWEQFGRYFRMEVELLRTGESEHGRSRVVLPARPSPSPAGYLRSIPLLNWHQMEQIAKKGSLPAVIHAEAMVETTDVSGTRTFALKVPDDSMEPLFSKGEMIFVNPDVEYQPGDYVIAERQNTRSASAVLRQVKRLGDQCMLHPLNRQYDDLPLTKRDVVRGKVVRLRKNL